MGRNEFKGDEGSLIDSHSEEQRKREASHLGFRHGRPDNTPMDKANSNSE